MATINEKMTGLADAVRAKTGETGKLSIDGMTTELNGIPNRTSSDLTVSGATVTAPAGNYKTAASKSIASGSATTPATTITANPTISVGTDGKITASVSSSKSVTPTVSAGYVSSGTAGTVSVSGSATSQLTLRDSNSLSASGATVNVPAGYYAAAASKSVSTVTRADTKMSVTANDTNDKLTISAENNQSTGYVTGSNQTANKVVTLSVSTPTIDGSGNVTAVATAQDNSSTPVKVSKTSSALALGAGSLSVSGKTVTASKGYYSSNTSTSVADGSYSASVSLTSGAGTATATGTNVTLTEVSSKPSSGYYITATGSGSVSATGTATVDTAGYVTTGNKTSNPSSKSSNTATKYYTIATEEKTVTPSTSTQTVTPTTNKLISKVSVAAVPNGTLQASGTATVSATVTPGAVTLAKNTSSITNKTRIDVTPVTATTDVGTSRYIAVKPSVAAGTGTISGSGTANASVTTAGYVSTSTTGSGTVSISGTATSSAKDGSVYYLPIPDNYVDTSSGDAIASDIISGKKAWVDGSEVIGNIVEHDSSVPFDGYPGGENEESYIFWARLNEKTALEHEINLTIPRVYFGDAGPHYVSQGYRFSSSEGMDIEGKVPIYDMRPITIDPTSLYFDSDSYYGSADIFSEYFMNDQDYQNALYNGEVSPNFLVERGEVQIAMPADKFGDAPAWAVHESFTFTSADGLQQQGTMPSHGTITETLSAGSTYTIPEGYHNGYGTVTATPLSINTWPVTLRCGTSTALTFNISYTNSQGVFTTTTCQNYGSVTINVAENSLVKVSCSNGRNVYMSDMPPVPECQIINNESTEFGLWFGSSSSRPAKEYRLYDSNRTCTIQVNTLDGYGSVGFSYVDASGTRRTVTVNNNTTQSFTVLCGCEIRLIDQSGDGLYFGGMGYWTQIYSADPQTDAYRAPNHPSQIYTILMQRD